MLGLICMIIYQSVPLNLVAKKTSRKSSTTTRDKRLINKESFIGTTR